LVSTHKDYHRDRIKITLFDTQQQGWYRLNLNQVAHSL